MIDIPIHHDLEQKFEWLRELYPWSLLMGELIHLCDVNFGSCEFAKGIDDQDEEMALFQFWACIEKLYDLEYPNQLVKKLLIETLIV